MFYLLHQQYQSKGLVLIRQSGESEQIGYLGTAVGYRHYYRDHPRPFYLLQSLGFARTNRLLSGKIIEQCRLSLKG